MVFSLFFWMTIILWLFLISSAIDFLVPRNVDKSIGHFSDIIYNLMRKNGGKRQKKIITILCLYQMSVLNVSLKMLLMRTKYDFLVLVAQVVGGSVSRQYEQRRNGTMAADLGGPGARQHFLHPRSARLRLSHHRLQFAGGQDPRRQAHPARYPLIWLFGFQLSSNQSNNRQVEWNIATLSMASRRHRDDESTWTMYR